MVGEKQRMMVMDNTRRNKDVCDECYNDPVNSACLSFWYFLYVIYWQNTFKKYKL